MKSSRLAAFAVLVAAIGTGSTARADDAEAFFAQGRTLRTKGSCAEAIVAFRRALDLKPQGLGSLRNVAECEEELGQFASARASFWSLRRAVLQANEPKYAGWDRQAEKAYQRLEPKVAHLTVKLTGTAPERAQVTIDGKPLDPRLIGVELERDLGPHTIEATYGGAAPVVEKRTLAIGAHEVVTLAIPEAKPEEPAPAATPVDAGSRSLRGAGIAAVAVGGVGAIGLAISLAIRQSALSSFSGCPGYVGCDPSLRGELTRGQTASTLAFVFGAAAIAGVGAGVPMIVVGSRSPAPASDPGAKAGASARGTIGIVPSPGGAVVRAAVRF